MKKYVSILIGLMLSLCLNVNLISINTLIATSTGNNLYDNISESENYSSIFDSISDNWYYLPAYPNYAPNGLPDFSQLQQDDWRSSGHPDLCGAVSLADILWWFDSKHENPNGKPGDGINTYPLVTDYHAPSAPEPGPYSDDHSFNNVNDNQTEWHRFRRSGELIERIAWYTNRQKDALWWKMLGPLNAFCNAFKLYLGAKIWLKEVGLNNQFTVKIIAKPDFFIINEYVSNNSGVILGLSNYVPGFGIWGHFVAVAGINPNGYIALSDPVQDVMSPSLNPAEHNNASIVSHDIYKVNFTSPLPCISSWYLSDYFEEGGLVLGAVIISEKS